MVAGDELAGLLADAAAKFAISDKPFQGGNSILFVGRLKQEARGAILDQFFRPSHIGGHDRDCARHRLHYYVRRAFVLGSQQQNVSLLETGPGVCHRARKDHSIRDQTQLPRQGFQLRFQGTIPDDYPTPLCSDGLAQVTKDSQKAVEAFLSD